MAQFIVDPMYGMSDPDLPCPEELYGAWCEGCPKANKRACDDFNTTTRWEYPEYDKDEGLFWRETAWLHTRGHHVAFLAKRVTHAQAERLFKFA